MKKGFTLLELLLVISLIGILVSVAVMRFDFFTEISEKVEIRTMVNQLRFSRNKAISSGKRTYVNFTDEGVISLLFYPVRIFQMVKSTHI